MWSPGLVVKAGLSAWLFTTCLGTATEPLSSSELSKSNEQSFAVRGIVKELNSGARTVLVNHEAITNYMDGMTMPF